MVTEPAASNDINSNNNNSKVGHGPGSLTL